MSFKRWLPTFLAFPLGGLVAIETVGSLEGPASAAAGGLVVGAAVGVAQWLALRPRGIGARWAAATAGAVAAGAALAALVTGAGTDVPDVMAAGLITGAAVGAAQSALLARGPGAAAAWTATNAAGWSLAWLATSGVITDVERGHHSFGASGATLLTVVTGLVLRRILGAPARTAAAAPVAAVRPAAA